MHQHLRLGQGAIDQDAADPLPGSRLLGIQGQLQVLGQVPVGKQLQLTTQQSVVIHRQTIRQGQLLEFQQGIQRRGEQLIGVLRGNYVQIGLPAQIGQQQKALRQVSSKDLRHMHIGLSQQPGDLDEGRAVFLGWRRIHHNQRAATPFPAKITAEAGVTAGTGEAGRRHGAPPLASKQGRQLQLQPVAQLG